MNLVSKFEQNRTNGSRDMASQSWIWDRALSWSNSAEGQSSEVVFRGYSAGLGSVELYRTDPKSYLSREIGPLRSLCVGERPGKNTNG